VAEGNAPLDRRVAGVSIVEMVPWLLFRGVPMEMLPTILALLVTVGIAWLAARRQYVFVVQLAGGEPKLARGKVTAAFLRELREVCQQARVARGWVGGVGRGKQVTLEFSGDIPPPLRQRLRNLWLLHR
jgi:hypothetical protein